MLLHTKATEILDCCECDKKIPKGHSCWYNDHNCLYQHDNCLDYEQHLTADIKLTLQDLTNG